MDAQIESHQPLITPRIIFATKAFPPPPSITARIEFPPFSIPQHHEQSTTPAAPEEHSSTPKRHTIPKCTSTPNRHTTPKHASTSRRHAMPQQNAASTGKQRPQGTSVVFMNVDSDTSQIENKLGWNNRTYESIIVSLSNTLQEAYSDQTYRLSCTKWQRTN